MDARNKKELSKIHVTDLLQFCCLSGLTGTAEIRGPSRKGHVYLKDGNIVDAVTATLRGEDALFKLINTPAGEFEFHEGSFTGGQTIRKGWEFLLLEAARLRDAQGEEWEEQAEGAGRVVLSLRRVPHKRVSKPLPPAGPVTTTLTGLIRMGNRAEECIVDRLGLDECLLRSLAVFRKGDRFEMTFRLHPASEPIRIRGEVLSIREDDLSVHVRFLSVDSADREALKAHLAGMSP